MRMPKTKAGIDGMYACMCAVEMTKSEKGDDYKPTCADVTELQAAISASDCTPEGLAVMGIEVASIAEFGTVMAEEFGLSC